MCKFCGLPSKLVLENMLSHARTMLYMVLNDIIIKLLYTIFQGQVKVGVGQVKIESHLPYVASCCKS